MTSAETDKLKEIFCQRLLEIMAQREIPQTELSYLLGMDRSTVNKWIKKKSLPRMAVIEKLAAYFGVEKSYFLDEDADTEKRSYYLNPETAAIAQQIHDNPGMRILFDAAKDVSPEDLKTVADLVSKMRKQENGDYE